jgi:hypothetical protein
MDPKNDAPSSDQCLIQLTTTAAIRYALKKLTGDTFVRSNAICWIRRLADLLFSDVMQP